VRSSNFSGSLVWFWSFAKSRIFWVPWSLFRDYANWSLGGEKSCIVCSLVCIFIIIIIVFIIIGCISSYFVVLLNCLCLNPQVFPFCPFLLPVLLEGKGRGEQAAVWCLAGGCWIKLWQLGMLRTWTVGLWSLSCVLVYMFRGYVRGA